MPLEAEKTVSTHETMLRETERLFSLGEGEGNSLHNTGNDYSYSPLCLKVWCRRLRIGEVYEVGIVSFHSKQFLCLGTTGILGQKILYFMVYLVHCRMFEVSLASTH